MYTTKFILLVVRVGDRRGAYLDLVGKQKRLGTPCVDGTTTEKWFFKK
jgi:hypothetical protein